MKYITALFVMTLAFVGCNKTPDIQTDANIKLSSLDLSQSDGTTPSIYDSTYNSSFLQAQKDVEQALRKNLGNPTNLTVQFEGHNFAIEKKFKEGTVIKGSVVSFIHRIGLPNLPADTINIWEYRALVTLDGDNWVTVKSELALISQY